ncbi:40S ribosomal protein S15 [Trichinella spiralis]|uniref:40S ribosomal protein S15 n=1 Tax=Trichinella spiralis TaxID=6334 RepID=UPI0001EFCA90|nr:40S ribosomal protein S15 [Trichinella spiralis]
MTSSSLFSYIWPMRYLIFLCASGTTLGDGVRESTVSGSVRSAGPLLANSHFLIRIIYFIVFFTAHLFPRQNLCSKCLVLCMQQLTLSCCERENVTTSSAVFAAQSIHNIFEWREHIWLAHSLHTVLYLAWYLVQDQEDEFQFAAAVFCQTFALQAASQIRLLSWSNGNNVSVVMHAAQ